MPVQRSRIRQIATLARKVFLLLASFAATTLLLVILGVASMWALTIASISSVALIAYSRSRAAKILLVLLPTLAVAIYFSLSPSNTREWKAEVARLPKIQISDEQIAVENLRNFEWNAPDQFEPNWSNRTYKLSEVNRLDVLVVPFGDSEQAAHVMLSFGFQNGQHLIVSVESRPEIGESYSLLGGAARQLELIYVFGTESDLLGLRILHRNDRVYAFPLKTDKLFIQELLLDLCQSANELHEHPMFYATLRQNCTTTLLQHVNRRRQEPLSYSKEVLFPARVGELLHRLDYLDTDLSWPQAKQHFRVDQKVRQADDLSNFSQTLRQGL